jgi:HlyD family secretion protein
MLIYAVSMFSMHPFHQACVFLVNAPIKIEMLKFMARSHSFVIVIPLYILLVLMVACNSKEGTSKPEVKPLIEAVYASGNVVSKDEYQVFSQAEGYVLQKLVQDGANLKAGDALYILESGQQSSRFDLAKKNFEQAQRNYDRESPVLREALAAIEAAKTKVQFDSVNFVRFDNLLKKNATTQVEYDRAKVQFDNSKNEYRLQMARYEKIKNQLFLELENAKSQLTIAGNESGKYIIRSERSGKVFKTLKEKGELVKRGESIAVVGDNNTFYLSLNVDELDIRRIKAGQEVVANIDAYGEEMFYGKVDKIYPFVNRQQQSIRVDVSLNDTLPQFYSGLAVEANIIIRKKEKALVVPKGALVDNTFLIVETEKGVEKVKVEKGVETLEEVEIVKGISADTQLVISK